MVFVDSSVAISGDGRSWKEAVKDLADAVRLSQITLRVKKIKVAQGTYYPKYSAGFSYCSGILAAEDRTFVQRGFDHYLPNDTSLLGWFGGYPSGGSADAQRNPERFPTVLDGRDTSYHVVVKLMSQMSDQTQTFIDGFTIKSGNARDTGFSFLNDYLPIPRNKGAGIYVRYEIVDKPRRCTLNIRNCTIKDNTAAQNGGGIYVDSLQTDLALISMRNNQILRNISLGDGGGMYMAYAIGDDVTTAGEIINCRFSGNSAKEGSGGALFCKFASTTIRAVNSLFSGNLANVSGGAIYSGFSSAIIFGCTFSGNKSNQEGSAIFRSGKYIFGSYTNNIFWGNANPSYAISDNREPGNPGKYSILEGAYTLGKDNVNSDPLFVDPQSFSKAPTDSGNYRLRSVYSPAFNTAFLEGNSNYDIQALNDSKWIQTPMDLGHNPRVNACWLDKGAYEYTIRPDSSGVLYVDGSTKNGTGDGSSCANAMHRLADALEFLKCAPTHKVKTIKVAAGTYYPVYRHNLDGTEHDNGDLVYGASADQLLNFYISDSVALMGGYPSGGGTDVVRDPILHKTTMDGNQQSKNVLIVGADHVLIDGFEIANGKSVRSTVGVVGTPPSIAYNSCIVVQDHHHFVMQQCRIRDNDYRNGFNFSSQSILYLNNNTSPTIIRDCWIEGNKTGGAILSYSSSEGLSVANTKFSGNEAVISGLAYNPCLLRLTNGHAGSTVTFTNCLFSGNASPISGLLIAENVKVNFVNATVVNNKVDRLFIGKDVNCPSVYNSIIYNESPLTIGTGQILNSIVKGGYSANGSYGNWDVIPDFVQALPFSAIPTTAGDYALALPLLAGSNPAIDAGSNSYYIQYAGAQKNRPLNRDLADSSRVQGCSIDIGAYEYHDDIWSLATPDDKGVVYVDSSVGADGDGKSWGTAISSLSLALRSAWFDKDIKQIKVARGTYYPLFDANQHCDEDVRNRTFSIPAGVQVLGGYSTATGQSIYDVSKNITTLSGLKPWENLHSYHTVFMGQDSAILDGFVIKDGKAKSGLYNDNCYGGGVFVKNALVGLRNNLITENSAFYGGGLLVLNTDPAKKAFVTSCYFLNNTTEDYDTIWNGYHLGGWGGGALLRGGIVDKCIFVGNFAETMGAGVHIEEATITNSAFIANQAYGSGSGVAFIGSYFDTRTPIGRPSKVIGCLVSGNSIPRTDGEGAAIWAVPESASASFRIVNTTIAGNYGPRCMKTNSNVSIVNSIVWGNGGGSTQIDGNTGSYDHCIVQGGSGGNLLNENPGFFEAVSANLAPTLRGNYHIGSCSPAVNGGIIVSEIADTGAVDLDGFNRISGTQVDIGAYEFNDFELMRPSGNVLYVDSSVVYSGDGNSWATATSSLAEALLAAARDSSIRIIKVARGTYLPQYNIGGDGCTNGDFRDRTFTLLPGLKVYGRYPSGGGLDEMRSPGKNKTILSGDIGMSGLDSDNAYHVLVAEHIDSNTILDGFTIRDGVAKGNGAVVYNHSSFARNQGGGLFVSGSGTKGLISNCVVLHNTAQSYGAGMFIGDSSEVIIQNCIVDNNTSESFGGGMVVATLASPRLQNVVFVRNKAQMGGAMGIYSHAAPTVVNGTFYKNSSLKWGAAMDNEGGTHTKVKNTVFSNNDDGAGTYGAISGGPQVENCLVYMPSGIYKGLNNINLEPLFADTVHLEGLDGIWGTMDDGLKLQLCSPAINMGDNEALGLLDTLDLSQGPRILQYVVDMGAYESMGFELDTVPNHRIVPSANCGKEWKQFYDASGKLAIAVRTKDIFGANLQIISSLNSQYGSGSTDVLNNPFGFIGNLYPMNRSWQIQSATELSGPIGIRFYFNKQDSIDLAAHFPLNSLEQLIAYKVQGNDAYREDASGFEQQTYATIADTLRFTLGTYQGLRYAEFYIKDFISGTLALWSGLPLPNQSFSFALSVENCQVLLSWKVNEQENLKGTEVQYSVDGVSFQTIGILQKAVKNSYSFAHEQNMPTGYYRLKFVDLEGNYQWSQWLRAQTRCVGKVDWGIAPNPLAEGGNIRLYLPDNHRTNITIQILDIIGRTVARDQWLVHQGEQERFVPFQDLPPGMYTVSLLDEEGQKLAQPLKVVKK